MTDRGSSSPVHRPAKLAGWLAAFLIGVAIFVPLYVLWIAAVVLLRVTKPFIYYPLALGTVGGVIFGGYFAFVRAWSDAGEAILVALVGGAVLAAYSALAERLDPEFLRPPNLPPWWWNL